MSKKLLTLLAIPLVALSMTACSGEPTPVPEQAAVVETTQIDLAAKAQLSAPQLVGKGNLGQDITVRVYKVAEVDAATAASLGADEKDAIILRYDVTNRSAKPVDVKSFAWDSAYWNDTPGAGAAYNNAETNLSTKLGYEPTPAKLFEVEDQWLLQTNTTASWYAEWNPVEGTPKVLIDSLRMGDITQQITVDIERPVPTETPASEDPSSSDYGDFNSELNDLLNK